MREQEKRLYLNINSKPKNVTDCSDSLPTVMNMAKKQKPCNI